MYLNFIFDYLKKFKNLSTKKIIEKYLKCPNLNHGLHVCFKVQINRLGFRFSIQLIKSIDPVQY